MPLARLTTIVPLARLRSVGGYRLLQYATVAAGLIAMIAYVEPGLPAPRRAMLAAVLWCCLSFFAAEWGWQIIRALRAPEPASYLLSATFFIDALAVLPVPLVLLGGAPAATAWLFAIFWLLKLARHSPGLARLSRVISLEAKPLASVLVIFIIVLFFSGTAIHLFERAGQPEAFGSLSSSLWWAIATLTTVGYGDAVPQTQAGRVVAGLVMICGVGVFGLLTGILATGFVDDSRRHNFVQNWDLVKGVPFFRNLDPAGIIEISRVLRRVDIAEGATIIRRGREGDCMYFLASGEVEVEVEPKPVRLGPGAFFGEMALLGKGIRTATVTALLPSTLLVLDLADFRTLTAHNAGLAAAIEAEAQRRNADPRDMKIEPVAR